MRVFRRSQVTDAVTEMIHAPGRLPVAADGATDVSIHRDTGPILVAVEGHTEGWDALEWAAAEAAARRCALRIVHAISVPTPTLGVFGSAANGWDAGIQDAGERLLNESARRAREVAPALQITTYLHAGSTAAAVLREGRRDAMIVLGQDHRVGRSHSVTRSVSRQVARRAECPVTIVELLDHPSSGPSAGRVVVAVDPTVNPMAALEFAFRAAQRRDVGVTVLLAWMPRTSIDINARVALAVQQCRNAFPDVEVWQRVIAVTGVPALVVESMAAALTVFGLRAQGRFNRAFFKSVGTAFRSAHSPVAIVTTSG